MARLEQWVEVGALLGVAGLFLWTGRRISNPQGPRGRTLAAIVATVAGTIALAAAVPKVTQLVTAEGTIEEVL